VNAPSTDPADAAREGMRDAKREMRARILAARDQQTAAAGARASQAICTALAARHDFRDAHVVLLTLPFGSEWDTAPLVDMALGQDKTVALPRVGVASRTLDLCVVTDLLHDVAPGYRGIREPLSRCHRVDPHLIGWVLVPGVAFDPAGRRLGYGGGFYDRLLPSLRPAAPRIAGAFELQIVDRVPASSHDMTIDAIVTELRTLAPARTE
jgi:5-formyltetrahydrofolate cyclo-ligase